MSLKDSLTAVVTGSWNKDEDNSFLAVAIADFTHPSDRFIPTTRRELVGRLIQKNDIIAKNEEEKFEQFALALDGVLTSSHHQTLTDLKVSEHRLINLIVATEVKMSMDVIQ